MRHRSHRSRAALALASAALLGVAVAGPPTPSVTTPRRAPGHDGQGVPKPTPTWDRSPTSMAAVGDSITRGFDACTVLSDCPEVSWATGSDTKVKSLACGCSGRPGPPSAAGTGERGDRCPDGGSPRPDGTGRHEQAGAGDRDGGRERRLPLVGCALL